MNKAFFCHKIDGRFRLRIPSKRHDSDFFFMIENELQKNPEIECVKVNAQTASLLVCYAPSLSENNIFELLRERWNVVVVSELELATPIDARVRGIAERLDSSVHELSSGQLNSRSIVFVGLAVTALVQVGRGQVLVPAMSLLWYATQTLLAGRSLSPQRNEPPSN